MSNKLTIITGTNRLNSNSEKVANQYAQMAVGKGFNVAQIHLKDMPKTFAFSETFGHRTESFKEMVDEKIVSCEKFVFVIAEYNGGFPGVLKTFIDAVPPESWYEKKAGLIGLSAGRAGALRAMDQFTNVLNYLKINVYHLKPKLSGISGLLDDSQIKLVDEECLKILNEQLIGLKSF